MNGITTNWVSGPMMNAVSGEADCSTDCAKPNTRPCRSNGTTFCSVVCSDASMNGERNSQMKQATPSISTDDWMVNTAATDQMIRFTVSSVLSGFRPSP